MTSGRAYTLEYILKMTGGSAYTLEYILKITIFENIL